MDRQGDTPPAATFDVDGEPEGWDAYTVWRTRVHAPRRASTTSPPVKFDFEEPGSGWDPLQTWQLRVRRPRER